MKRLEEKLLYNMKTWITKISSIVIIILIIVVYAMNIRIKDLNKSLSISKNNEKAYLAENSGLKESNIVFKHDLAQMIHMNDSILIKMREVANELKIKDKKLESLQYQLEHISKSDTVFIKDTIFKEPGFKLDTCIQNKWAKTCLHLEYPNEVAVSSEFNNEKYVITSWKREPIKYRKWFLPRWFTKKQKIIIVDVVDKNPYVTTEKQRFVQIVD